MARALTRTVFTLSACQGLMTSTNAMVVACAALVGLALANDPVLATLPAALKHVSTMLCAAPASQFMARFGRRAGFQLLVRAAQRFWQFLPICCCRIGAD